MQYCYQTVQFVLHLAVESLEGPIVSEACHELGLCRVFFSLLFFLFSLGRDSLRPLAKSDNFL